MEGSKGTEELFAPIDPDGGDGFTVCGTEVEASKLFDFRLPSQDIDDFERDYALKQSVASLSDTPPKPEHGELFCPSNNCKFWIQVSSPEKRSEGIITTYYVYRITGYYYEQSNTIKREIEVFRRFSQFEELMNKLLGIYPSSLFPHMPPKSISSVAVLLDSPEFLDSRTKSLDSLMKKLLTHHAVNRSELDEDVKHFLMKGDVSKSTKMSALAQAVKGTTSNQLSKAKNYLGSFFGAAKTPMNYNTGGVESDSLRKSQKFFKDLAEVLAGFIKKLNSIVAHLEKKSQGHGQQASLFTSIKNDTQKLELLGLEASQIEKLAKVNEQSETRVNAFKVCIKNYYLFYFEDLLGDVQAAAYRIQERLDKETQIKANIMNITDLATLQDQWDTHVRIMNEMTKEMSLYQAQSQQSLINLLSSLERSKAKHYNELSAITKNSGITSV